MPSQALERLLRDAPKSRRSSEPNLGEVVLPDAPAQRPTLLQRTEAEMLACILAKPELLVDLDFDQTPLQVPEIKQLFDWSVEGLAIGRDAGPDLFRYLFARAAERPDTTRAPRPSLGNHAAGADLEAAMRQKRRGAVHDIRRHAPALAA